MRSEKTKDQAERLVDIVELGRIQSPGELTQPELPVHGAGLLDKYSCLDVVDDDGRSEEGRSRSVDVLVVGRLRELLLVEQDGGAWGESWYALVPQESCEVRR